jgi:hypothetical protein
MAVAVRPNRRPLGAVPVHVERTGLAAWPLLAALVSLSVVVRAVIGWLRETPIYLGDEYLYAAVGRSIAETGHPLVRGGASHFPALLQPILTAPAWLVSDVGTAYHLVQLTGAIAMSLAAVPVYWLARRLALGKGIGLGLAALTLALPDLIYATWVIAEPFAYPLVLAATAAAVAAIAKPSPRAQLAFVAFAGLAAFGRIQFILLPACFLGAVLVVGLREGRLRAALREQLLPLELLAVPVAVALAIGPSRVLAFYKGVLHTNIDPAALAQSTGTNLIVLLYASGFVLVPGAILGLALAVARPRTRTELVFAVFTSLLSLTLLAEAGIFGASKLAQERYVFYVLPLVAIGFALYASRGWPYRLYHVLLASGLVAVVAVVPLAGYAAANEKMHSPLLYGAFRIEQWAGSPGSGSLLIALAATAATAIVVLSSSRPQLATKVGLGLALLLCAGFSAAAVVFDEENTSSARQAFFGENPSWVDSAKLGDVTMLRNIDGQRAAAFQQLFWNRSVTRLALMPGATIIDPFRADPVRVEDDGSLLVNGRLLAGALLVDEHAVTMRLSGARQVASAPGFLLYAPAGTPRLSLFFPGRFHDGWLGEAGAVTLWPRLGRDRLEGALVLDLDARAQSAGATVHFTLPGGQLVDVRVPAGSARTASFPVCAQGAWTAQFRSRVTGYAGTRPVSVHAGVPRFVAGAGVCAAAPKHEPALPPSVLDRSI